MDWTKKRVLVTGGGGFLGTHLLERLRSAGCIDPFVVHHSEYDLSQEEQTARLFREHPADIVFHLAGLVGGNWPNQKWPARFFYQNLMMGTLALHYSWKSGAEKFIGAGAGCAYPEHAPLPLKEESYWDGFPQRTSFAYALAKRTLHAQSLAYWNEHRFPAIVTLLGNIYGPNDNFDLENAHVLPALIRKFVEAAAMDHGKGQTVVVWGSGKPARDFVYVGDVAGGMVRAAEVYDRAELVNLSSGQEYTIRETVEALVEITGFEGKITWDVSKPEGQEHRMFDTSKAEHDLGFHARTSLREGLTLTVEWYRRHGTEAHRETRELA